MDLAHALFFAFIAGSEHKNYRLSKQSDDKLSSEVEQWLQSIIFEKLIFFSPSIKR